MRYRTATHATCGLASGFWLLLGSRGTFGSLPTGLTLHPVLCPTLSPRLGQWARTCSRPLRWRGLMYTLWPPVTTLLITRTPPVSTVAPSRRRAVRTRASCRGGVPWGVPCAYGLGDGATEQRWPTSRAKRQTPKRPRQCQAHVAQCESQEKAHPRAQAQASTNTNKHKHKHKHKHRHKHKHSRHLCISSVYEQRGLQL